MTDSSFGRLIKLTWMRFIAPMGRVGLFCLILSSRTFAQPNDDRSDIDSAGLTVEASAGWDGMFDPSTPVHISFLLRNDSERSIEGVLRLTDRLSGKEVTLGDIVISPGSTRRFTSIQSLRDWYECVAHFQHDGKTIWRRELGQMNTRKFNPNMNYAMIVDQGGRRPALPGSVTDSNSAMNQDPEVAGRQGRQFRCLKVKPWQLPNHAGPLCVIQAIVFPEGTAERDLNQVQWKAVTEWMCQGGTVFVHDKSREIIDRIIELSPLQTEAPIQSGSFMMRRFGLGGLHEYSQAVFSSDADEIRQSLADAVANLKRNYLGTFADAGSLHVIHEQRANKNRFLVGSFFGIYTLLTGVATLFLFRLNQKQIAAFTVFVVVAASLFSGLLGAYLRFSPGDLNWVTVTQAGIGGLVQVGAIEVQSAGSRNTRVAVKGEHADLQWITRERYHHYGVQQNFSYSPFVWQANLAANPDDSCQINVPMTLWGRRRCHATAFKRDLQPIDFEIEFEPRERTNDANGVPAAPSDVPVGLVSLKLVNRLPFELTNCWLVVGITTPASQQLLAQYVMTMQTMQFWRGSTAANASVDGLIDVYHVRRLSGLKAGATIEEQTPSNFQVIQRNDEMLSLWPNDIHLPPRISQMGTASAWIIGRIKNSPIMQIDQQNTDFLPQEQIHFFIQEILPEDMPETLQFSKVVP